MDEMPDLSLVRRLKAKGRYDEAQRQLEGWLRADPENPLLLYEMALVLDNQGHEMQAIPFYQDALKRDLDKLHRVDAMVGLGSSLRVAGRIHESYEVLFEASKEFPHHTVVPVFLAMTLERMGNYGDAISTLLQVIAETGRGETLDQYRPALRYLTIHRHDGPGNALN